MRIPAKWRIRVFVSYRREDSAGHTGRLYDSLVAHFGKNAVFLDLTAIRAGEQFDQLSRSAAGSHDVLLAVIGKTWLSCADATGRRIDNPEDLVRQEISAAMENGVPVIPVLVGGATMPPERDLPEGLRGLYRRNAFDISDTRWSSDMTALSREIGRLAHKPNIPYRYLALAMLLIGIALGLYLLFHIPSSLALQYAVTRLRSDDLNARISAVLKLEEIAKNSDQSYWEAVTSLAGHIRDRAPWRNNQLVGFVSADVQAALTALGRRRKSYGKGESQRLDLHNIDVSGATLRGAHLESVILWGSNLNRVDLWGAQLQEADLGGVSLEEANLEMANLSGAKLWESTLAQPLRPSSLRGARLDGARLDGTDLRSADLRMAVGLTEDQLRSAILK